MMHVAGLDRDDRAGNGEIVDAPGAFFCTALVVAVSGIDFTGLAAVACVQKLPHYGRSG